MWMVFEFGKFGGVFERYPEDAEGLEEGAETRHGEGFVRPVGTRIAVSSRFEVFPVEEEFAPGGFEDGAHFGGSQEGVPEAVVVEDAGQVGPGGEEGAQGPFDWFFERSPVDEVLHGSGKGHVFEWAGEMPILFRYG